MWRLRWRWQLIWGRVSFNLSDGKSTNLGEEKDWSDLRSIKSTGDIRNIDSFKPLKVKERFLWGLYFFSFWIVKAFIRKAYWLAMLEEDPFHSIVFYSFFCNLSWERTKNTQISRYQRRKNNKKLQYWNKCGKLLQGCYS